jgi:tetratricopeptide (TPR) repeat protein
MISVSKISLFFILMITSEVFSQTSLQKQFNYANNLFNTERYFDAITEFKRLIYFDKENEFSFVANFNIGLSYKSGGKFSEALKYFTLAEINAKNDTDLFLAKTYQIRTNIRRRSLQLANRIIDQLDIDKRFDSNKAEINYWRGWAYIFSDEWDKAYSVFSKDNLDTTLARICKNADENKYSVSFAKYSSVILPGFGQFYTGEYVSGLISLGWNALFGYLTVNSFLEERVFDGIVAGNFLWLRFYSGNIQNAEKFAEQKNLKISNSALDYLQYNFKGLKP